MQHNQRSSQDEQLDSKIKLGYKSEIKSQTHSDRSNSDKEMCDCDK